MHKVKSLLFSFLKDKKGSFAPLFACSLVAVLIAGGGVIDYQMAVKDKHRAQGVADSAVLAAAIEFKKTEARKRSRRVAKADYDFHYDEFYQIDGYNLRTVIKNKGNNTFRIITSIRGETKTNFLGVLKVKSMNWNVVSHTEVSFTNTEVVMVLDVSMSMRREERLVEMKKAAASFINDIEPYKSDQSYLAVSLIPYAEHVNFGQESQSWLKKSEQVKKKILEPYNGCVVYNKNDRIGRLTPIKGNDYKERDQPYTMSDGTRVDKFPLCPPDTSKAMFYSTDKTKLVERVEGMELGFGTGTGRASHWAARAFNPSWRTMMASYGYPAQPIYNTTKKYAIILTDGLVTHSDDNQNGQLDGQEDDDAEDYGDPSVSPRNLFIESCKALKDEDVNIYTINYVTDGHYDTEMEKLLMDCVSGTGKYFRADKQNLNAVFASVNKDVNNIRLTK